MIPNPNPNPNPNQVDPPHRIMAKNTALATLDPTEQVTN